LTLVDFLLLALVAAVAGALGQSIAGYSLGGCFISAVVGFVGAWLGSWLSGVLGLSPLLVISTGGRGLPLIWSVIGSVLLTVMLGVLMRPTRELD
jgi:uncharacterized membrane protein YeaQ/YmgE (transglycosylase-associated protein family)